RDGDRFGLGCTVDEVKVKGAGFWREMVLVGIKFKVVVTTLAPKEYQVGGAVDWCLLVANETELYNAWPSRRRFHIQDPLRFRFTYSVVIVEKWEFFHIDSDATAKPINLRFLLGSCSGCIWEIILCGCICDKLLFIVNLMAQSFETSIVGIELQVS
ncbi:putative cupredoxin, partial [Tanacetum coccineum]